MPASRSHDRRFLGRQKQNLNHFVIHPRTGIAQDGLVQATLFGKSYRRQNLRLEQARRALFRHEIAVALEETQRRLGSGDSESLELLRIEAQLLYLARGLEGRRVSSARLFRLDLANVARRNEADTAYARALVIAQAAARELAADGRKWG